MNDANFLQGIFTAEMIQITHWGFIFVMGCLYPTEKILLETLFY